MVNPQNGGDFYGEKCKIILLSLLIVSLTTLAVNFPTPTALKYINDYIGIISEDVTKKIYYIGKELEEKTTAELTVVIIDSLEGLSVEEYANQLFRRWGIGKKDKDNGVLFLVALKDRRMRIEVGYGLEGVITDGVAGRIRDDYIIPYFKKDDYSAGVYYGYLALAHEIIKEYKVELNENLEELPKVPGRIVLPEKVQIIVGPIVVFLFAALIIWVLFQAFKQLKDFILYDILHKPPSSPFKRLKSRKLHKEIRKMYIFSTSPRDLISGSARSVYHSSGGFGGGRSGGGGASGGW